jgi:DNA helicase-2/ATP-dependent DNA helicase PcrA
LVNAIGEFDHIGGFLEHVSLVMDNHQQNQQDMVNLMTLHAAKGLEFDTVFLAGWEESLFPHPRCLNENGLAGLEEERRLAYVGISRAKERAFITHCHQRRMFQGGWQTAVPSRFIKEIPIKHSHHVQANGQINHRNPSFGQNKSFHKPKLQTPKIITVHSFEIGDRVFHQKFGYGEIMNLDGDKLDVEFDHAGHKKIISDFISRA